MKVRFLGVRGSVPTPGSSTVRYGGNTVCTDVRLADGTVLILDAGTGLRELGQILTKEAHTGDLHMLLHLRGEALDSFRGDGLAVLAEPSRHGLRQ